MLFKLKKRPNISGIRVVHQLFYFNLCLVHFSKPLLCVMLICGNWSHFHYIMPVMTDKAAFVSAFLQWLQSYLCHWIEIPSPIFGIRSTETNLLSKIPIKLMLCHDSSWAPWKNWSQKNTLMPNILPLDSLKTCNICFNYNFKKYF